MSAPSVEVVTPRVAREGLARLLAAVLGVGVLGHDPRDQGHPEQVHPRDGRMRWDRTRTPKDPKVRAVDEGGTGG